MINMKDSDHHNNDNQNIILTIMTIAVKIMITTILATKQYKMKCKM